MNLTTSSPQNSAPLTMTSREIADVINAQLVEKGLPANVRHDNLKRSIERLAESGVFSLPPLEEVRIQQGRREEVTTVYKLDRRASIIVVAQVNPEVVAHLYDLWQAAEAKVKELEITLHVGQAKELALREGYGVNDVNFDLIKVIGKEAALFTELTRDALLRAEEDFKKLNLPPYKSQKYLNDIYNHALKRVYVRVKQEETHQRKLEVQQREIEAHNHKVWMAERKGLLNKSKHEAAEEALRLKMEKRHQLELNHLRLTA